MFPTKLGPFWPKSKTLLRGRGGPMEFNFVENQSNGNEFLAFFFLVFYF